MIRSVAIAVTWFVALSSSLSGVALVWDVPRDAMMLPSAAGALSVALGVELHRRRKGAPSESAQRAVTAGRAARATGRSTRSDRAIPAA